MVSSEEEERKRKLIERLIASNRLAEKRKSNDNEQNDPAKKQRTANATTKPSSEQDSIVTPEVPRLRIRPPKPPKEKLNEAVNEEWRERTSQQKRENRALRERNIQLEYQKADLAQQLEIQKNESQKEIARLNQRISAHQTEKAALKLSNDALEKQMAQCDVQNAELIRKLEERDLAIASGKKELEEERNRGKGARKKLAEIRRLTNREEKEKRTRDGNETHSDIDLHNEHQKRPRLLVKPPRTPYERFQSLIEEEVAGRLRDFETEKENMSDTIRKLTERAETAEAGLTEIEQLINENAGLKDDKAALEYQKKSLVTSIITEDESTLVTESSEERKIRAQM
ncbi:hypothetical protein BDV96DRAFT_647368 [Lophiotrema nucula]|uniref:Uncharacterized protein n=1 Tax=Lophiotrema nucula TaxID=690887 RepID=A0A6A5Z5P9_9PLEO|nr:hypothetical protein BDV96DRAFT_647368 [Lophiotrema nucula]